MDPDRWTSAAEPEAVVASLLEAADDLRHAADAHHHMMPSVRTETYKGHDIVVRTSYQITVDGRDFPIAPSLNNAGMVHYHGLPTRSFPSAVDLVKDAIDTFPEDFGAGAGDPGDGTGSSHMHGHMGTHMDMRMDTDGDGQAQP
jgi:hypothetical protein